MELNVWLAYCVAAWVIALSPGSGAVLSMSHGLSYGVRRTTATSRITAKPICSPTMVAGAGIGALLLASAAAFTVVKVLGAGYLLWLGWCQWRAPVEDAAPGLAGAGSEATLSVRQRVLRGALTNVTNPKGIVFMVAVLPQFIDPARPLWLQLLILLATTIVADVIVMHGYAWLASRLQRLLRSARARRSQNRVFGGVLMAMGASLFLVKRASQ